MLNLSKLVALPMSLAFGLVIVSSAVMAHTKVTTYEPKNGAILETAPKVIGLHFNQKIRLTKVTLRLDDQPGTSFNLNQFKDFKRTYSLTNELEGDGLYTLEWRGLAGDGHVMQDTLTFTVE